MEKNPEPAAEPTVIDRSTAEKILRAAFKAGASDVHFKAGERALLRIKGKLQALNAPTLRPEDTVALFHSLCPPHVKERAVEDIDELDFSVAIAGVGRFRVNTFRQRGTIALVVRVIPLQVPELKDLNLPPVLGSFADQSRGMVLVTGTTGSGKSTTIAALINRINHTRTAHVITIEDPIEFFFRNKCSSIVQREVGADTGSFAKALRAALRQDPDVIMIGEMRDTETIDIAIKAAETGHLVLSTAHTTDAAKTIARLVSVFPLSEQAMMRVRIAESLRAVVSQRLLPRADGSGLIPAAEVLVATRVIQECIRDAARTHQITEFVAQGRHYGMQSFDQALLRLLREGLVTRDVALSAATSPDDLDLKIRMGVDPDEEDLDIDRHLYEDAPETLEPPPVPAGAPSRPGTPLEPSKSLFDDTTPLVDSGSAVGSYGLRGKDLSG